MSPLLRGFEVVFVLLFLLLFLFGLGFELIVPLVLFLARVFDQVLNVFDFLINGA